MTVTNTTTALKQKLAPAKTGGTAIAPAKKKGVLGLILEPGFQKQMAVALPKTLTAERLTRIVMTEARKTPDLLKCTQESFMSSVLQAAQLGLEPGSALGHAYLIPYKRFDKNTSKYYLECQLQIGYRGMIELARRSGQIVSLQAYVVHEKDQFEYHLGLDPNIIHVPAINEDPGHAVFVYAVAKLKDGGVQFEVMSRAEIEKIRDTAKAKNGGPWATHWDEMAKKTVIRRLFKYLPVSIQTAQAIESEEKAERDEKTDYSDVIDAIYVETGDETSYKEALKTAEDIKEVQPSEEPEEIVDDEVKDSSEQEKAANADLPF